MYLRSLLLAFLFFQPAMAQAIPTPDIVAQVSGQLGSLFSVGGILMTIVIGSVGYGLMRGLKFVLQGPLITALILAVGVYAASSFFAPQEYGYLSLLHHHGSTEEIDQNLLVTPSQAHDDANALWLDVREPEEWERGVIPGSVTIRYADVIEADKHLQANGKNVYVFCTSGTRATRVAKVLNERGITSYVVKKGLKAWRDQGFPLEGSPSFKGDDRLEAFRKALTATEVKQFQNEGVGIIDARSSKAYEWWHVPGSSSYPALYTPSSQLEENRRTLPDKGRVMVLCDGADLSCFSALIASLHLDDEGYEIVGRVSDMRIFR